MWMMGYTDGGGDFNTNFQDSLNTRRLGRPLLPRTATAAAAASTNPPCLFHGSDLFALNHFAMAEQNKREFNTQQVVVSSRWNPAPEQLQALEELYRRGTRTPSAEEIQQITAQLRRYGKIEGKNVFYWFQNHKARERQKRRRQQVSPTNQQNNKNNDNDDNIHPNCQKKDPLEDASNRTRHEVEQTKYWASPTSSSTIPTEKSLSLRQGSSKEATVETTTTAAESKADGWLLFHDNITASPTPERDTNIHLHHNLSPSDHLLQHHTNNATWHHLSHHPSTSSHDTSTTTTVTKPNFVNMLLLEPYPAKNQHCLSEDGGGGSQTLQLFPVLGDGCGGGDENEDSGEAAGMGSSDVNGYQFFEFLPMKN